MRRTVFVALAFGLPYIAGMVLAFAGGRQSAAFFPPEQQPIATHCYDVATAAALAFCVEERREMDSTLRLCVGVTEELSSRLRACVGSV